ncbi:hypothetical protein F5J12DRAFT_903944 [Pisolithus orientalis]|uniref:uncharacterized protein n=1 Tax=Pisolithus orientalis TaxID=936130 RepID=UPI002224F9FC|nr:uncharacterized protein F5J12DRAFT_903944 [Pisolithus orientalis]KAI6025834.1 hypothetical protein F5J12DRAFT_903944 [Pisolithus orientalis]
MAPAPTTTTTYGVTPPDPSSLSFRHPSVRRPVAPIPLLAHSEFSRMHLQHATAHPPDSVLFPFLHGLEGNNEPQCSFFASTPSTAASAAAGLVQDPSGRAICPPRYRGLVWVLCDEDVDGELPQLATAPTRWEDDLVCDDSDSSEYSTDQPDIDRDVEFDDLANDAPPSHPVPCPMDMDPPPQQEPHMHPLALRIPTSNHAHHLPHDRRHSNASSSDSTSTDASASSSLANSDSDSTAATSLASPPCYSSSHAAYQEQSQSILGIHDSGVAFVQSAPQHAADPHKRPTILTSTFVPSQLIQPSSCDPLFPPIDDWEESINWEFKPVVVPDGISLRNFGIQVPLYPTISDIVIYSPRGASPAALRLAARFRRAVEKKLAERLDRWAHARGETPRTERALDEHPHITPEGFLKYEMASATDHAQATLSPPPEAAALIQGVQEDRHHLHRCKHANTIDFAQREKEEMRDLTRASEIITLQNDRDESHHTHASGSTTNTYWDPHAGQVFLVRSHIKHVSPYLSPRHGPLPTEEPIEKPSPFDSDANSPALGRGFDICIECHECAPLPGVPHLHAAEQHIRALEMEWVERCQRDKDGDWMDADEPCIPPRPPPHPSAMVHLPFPSSQQAMPSILNALFPLISWKSAADTCKRTPLPANGNGRGSYGARDPAPLYNARPLKVLLYSSDGYTESSAPALCLLMVVKGLSLPEAYLELQMEVGLLKKVEARLGAGNGQGRPRCYTYGSRDMSRGLVAPSGHSATEISAGSEMRPAVQPRTLRRPRASTLPAFIPDHQSWFDDARFDGSFPSRVLPFLYLGNLNHASNAYMLHALGITHVVSVGECALVPPPQTDTIDGDAAPTFLPYNLDESTSGQGPGGQGSLWIEEREGRIKVLDIKGVCDDGIDTLEHQLHPVCSWIEKARQSGGQVLVHCRVGVSRSATVTIAYMMQHLGLSLVESYLVVRSRRLSVLIQPNMRLLYNLLGWEVRLARERAGGDERKLREELRKALSWPYLAREVHALNEKYLS